MKRTTLFILLFSFAGCSKQFGIDPDISNKQLMNILGVTAWRANINEPGRQTIHKVTLYIRKRGEDKIDVLHLDLAENKFEAGSLVIGIQELAPNKNQYKLSISFYFKNESRETHEFIDDLFTGMPGLTNTSATIGIIGDSLLKAAGKSGSSSNINSDLNDVVLYVHNE
jgi:hypothetical protein